MSSYMTRTFNASRSNKHTNRTANELRSLANDLDAIAYLSTSEFLDYVFSDASGKQRIMDNYRRRNANK